MSVGKIKEFPFDRKGNLMHYPQSEWLYDEHRVGSLVHPVWMEVEPFEATLKYNGYNRGRSAAYFNWTEDRTGFTYPMFLKDLSELIKATDILTGVVYGKWEIVKRGMNYGIRKGS